MWTLIVVILWYRAPSITQVPGFHSQYACEQAAVRVNKKFNSGDSWVGSATEQGQSICVQVQE